MKFVAGIVALVTLSSAAATSVAAQTLSIEQVLQRVVDHYPSIRTAAIQVEKAKQEGAKIESQLGWQLDAQAGISRNVSAFAIASDKLDASGTLSQQLQSGSTLSINTSLTHETSETAIFTLPNPTTITNVDLNFRQKLARGANNPAFNEAKNIADAGVVISKAEKEKLYDRLAENVIELYLSAAITQQRISNIAHTVERTKRLQSYIKRREKLGIAEEKDTLQVNAQLNSQQAELSALNIVAQKQRIGLNRLMGAAVDAAFEVMTNLQIDLSDAGEQSFAVVYGTATKYSPQIKLIDGRIQQADSSVRLQRDAELDNLDLVLFIGARNQSGDTPTGSSNESDIIGGARLEFQQSQDKTGFDAQLYQAQLERSAAIEDKRQLLEDLHYDLSSLLIEIKASTQALAIFRNSVASEQKKLAEAETRFTSGRADTDQLIQFESQLSNAELSLELQQIELARRVLTLKLKQGKLWDSIQRHEIENYLTEENL